MIVRQNRLLLRVRLPEPKNADAPAIVQVRVNANSVGE